MARSLSCACRSHVRQNVGSTEKSHVLANVAIRLHNLRVFAVSGSSRDEFDSIPLPVDGWFSKPVRIDSLLQAVRSEKVPTAMIV